MASRWIGGVLVGSTRSPGSCRGRGLRGVCTGLRLLSTASSSSSSSSSSGGGGGEEDPKELVKRLRLPAGGGTKPQLVALCTACGLPTTGNKLALIARLANAVSTKQDGGRTMRVLSIDMGVRNLAFSLLEVGPTEVAPDTPAQSATGVVRRATLLSWSRVNLVPEQAADAEPAGQNRTQWSPTGMLDLALPLVLEQFLPLKPTHILIERQRWRSFGSSAVQEWTLRVNTLENMLHAILATWRRAKGCDFEVHSIGPRTVASYWGVSGGSPGKEGDELVGGDDVKGIKKQGNAYGAKKKLVVDLVGRWLAEDRLAVQDGPAAKTAAAFLKRVQDAATLKRQRQREVAVKLDDLADCLLQGMAWIEWQASVDVISTAGAELLLSKLLGGGEGQKSGRGHA